MLKKEELFDKLNSFDEENSSQWKMGEMLSKALNAGRSDYFHAYWCVLMHLGLTSKRNLSMTEREELAFNVGVQLGRDLQKDGF